MLVADNLLLNVFFPIIPQNHCEKNNLVEKINSDIYRRLFCHTLSIHTEKIVHFKFYVLDWWF